MQRERRRIELLVVERGVGAAGEIRSEGLDKPPFEAVFFPMAAIEGAPLWSPPRAMNVVVKTTSSPQVLVAPVRGILAELDPTIPIANVQTMERVVATSVAMARTSFTLLLLGIAGGMAILLSSVGLYGVLSYVVGQRTNEIGIRMAIGL